MKIIIAGGRSYSLTDSDIKELDKLKSEVTEVVSGTARGVDSDGEKWAESNNIPVKRFKPDWAVQQAQLEIGKWLIMPML